MSDPPTPTPQEITAHLDTYNAAWRQYHALSQAMQYHPSQARRIEAAQGQRIAVQAILDAGNWFVGRGLQLVDTGGDVYTVKEEGENL